MWNMPATSTDETKLVVAARAGDARAIDEIVGAYLPLVYTVVRRALGAGADVDDVVQDTMLRALRELRTLRDPRNFRSWLLTIAIRQAGTHLHRLDVADARTLPLDEAPELPDAGFEGPTLLHLELSDQRRQVVRASRWLDPVDRALLSLWWLEVAGRLTRPELAAAAGMRPPHAAVRVQRMRGQLDVSRSLVAALEARPRCAGLSVASTEWDGVPSPLWRKRLARHTRSCPICAVAAGDLIPPERLLAGFGLLAVPVALSAAVLGKSTLGATAASATTLAAVSSASGSGAAGAGGKAGGLLAQLAGAIGAHPVASAVAGTTLALGAAVGTAAVPMTSAPGVTAAPVVVPSTPVSTALAPSPTPPSSSAASPTAARSSSTGGLPLGPVSLESVDEPGQMVTIAEDLGVLARVDANSDVTARTMATFEVVRGLADASCVSFRAEDGRFLRHSSWRMRLSADEGTQLFRGDATFCVYAGSVSDSVTLRSSNYPNAFLRHREAELWLDQADGSAAFRADASFHPRPPLVR